MTLTTTSPVTPHDIAQLAWTRRHDRDLALQIATEAGKQSDLTNSPGKPVMKETAR